MDPIPEEYLDFWCKAFGLSRKEMCIANALFISSGRYIEKYGKEYFFLYQDLRLGKKILAASPPHLAALQNDLSVEQLQNLSTEELLLLPVLSKKELYFNDIDYGLVLVKDFRPCFNRNFCIKPLQPAQQPLLKNFYKDCSTDDQDTLDLTFVNDFALGLFDGDDLLGISRYAKVREARIADITVLMRKSARGKGLSVYLVSALVERILQDGLLPKYRVQSSLHASIRIAERLGFTPTHRLWTYSATL